MCVVYQFTAQVTTAFNNRGLKKNKKNKKKRQHVHIKSVYLQNPSGSSKGMCPCFISLFLTTTVDFSTTTLSNVQSSGFIMDYNTEGHCSDPTTRQKKKTHKNVQKKIK